MVNLEEMSAKELYELAKKKEQEETLQGKLQDRINEIKITREQLKTTYQEILKDIDEKLEELDKQRQTVIADHKKELDELNQELEKLIHDVAESQIALAEASSAEQEVANRKEQDAATESDEKKPTTEKSGGQAGISRDEEMDLLMKHMANFMKGRSYISESLLREKLQVVKFKPSTNLNKLLDALVQQARLVRRNGNNYVLGRKRK